jgi:hypothetical protein
MKARVTMMLLAVAAVATIAVAARLKSRGSDVGVSAPAPSGVPPSAVPEAPVQPAVKQAVILHLPVSGKGIGEKDEDLVCQQIEDDLEGEIDRAGVGEMDGNEIGEGECTLFMYGPDADKLFAAIAPRARSSRLGKHAWATKRYGSEDDPNARETRVDL